MHINKVHRVTTIDCVAALGDTVDTLYDVALGTDTEDGVIRVYGLGDVEVITLTDFCTKTLIELLKRIAICQTQRPNMMACSPYRMLTPITAGRTDFFLQRTRDYVTSHRSFAFRASLLHVCSLNGVVLL